VGALKRLTAENVIIFLTFHLLSKSMKASLFLFGNKFICYNANVFICVNANTALTFKTTNFNNNYRMGQ